MSSTNQKRLSNAISNINMNSYRAFKVLMNEGKLNSMINSNKNIKRLAEKNLDNNINHYTTNKTKHIFASNTQRFEWQTNKAKNSFSDLNFMSHDPNNIDNSDKRSKNYNDKENNFWKGMLNIREDDDNKTIYNLK